MVSSRCTAHPSNGGVVVRRRDRRRRFRWQRDGLEAGEPDSDRRTSFRRWYPVAHPPTAVWPAHDGNGQRTQRSRTRAARHAHRRSRRARLYVWNSSSNTISSAVVPNSQISSQSSVSWCSKDWLAVTAGGPDVFLFSIRPWRWRDSSRQAVNEDWKEVNTVAGMRAAAPGDRHIQRPFRLDIAGAAPARIARYERGDDNEVSGVISLEWLGPDTLAVGARDLARHRSGRSQTKGRSRSAVTPRR